MKYEIGDIWKQDNLWKVQGKKGIIGFKTKKEAKAFSESIRIASVKILLVEKLISKIEDKAIQNAIRNIIFDSDTQINWEKIEKILLNQMPELKKELIC